MLYGAKTMFLITGRGVGARFGLEDGAFDGLSVGDLEGLDVGCEFQYVIEK